MPFSSIHTIKWCGCRPSSSTHMHTGARYINQNSICHHRQIDCVYFVCVCVQLFVSHLPICFALDLFCRFSCKIEIRIVNHCVKMIKCTLTIAGLCIHNFLFIFMVFRVPHPSSNSTSYIVFVLMVCVIWLVALNFS